MPDQSTDQAFFAQIFRLLGGYLTSDNKKSGLQYATRGLVVIRFKSLTNPMTSFLYDLNPISTR